MLTIAISSTFTCEPIEPTLSFWMHQFHEDFEILFTPYNQLFQQLTDSESKFCQNQNGFNLILIRFEDWGVWSPYEEKHYKKFQKNLNVFLSALKSAIQYSKATFIVCICPPSSSLSNKVLKILEIEENKLAHRLEKISNVDVLTSKMLMKKYYVSNYDDSYGNELGHIPYTPILYTALGTLVARKIYTSQSTPCKVIVVDCDDTLWKGSCAELGVEGIEVSSSHQYFQKFLIKQQEFGRLICLCSKNNENDVLKVLSSEKMLLKLHHLSICKINWNPKSKNICDIANELNLGLNSFVFIDNNPVECVEVGSKLPEVNILLFPEDEVTIPQFLKNMWIFDYKKLTEEDKKRTNLYFSEMNRKIFRNKVLNLSEFITALKLEVKIQHMTGTHVTRIAQLTQRTNQFNFTTIRRNEGEVLRLLNEKKYECREIYVTDRFGDYGLVGVLIFEIQSEKIGIETFLLSCRVLGRGVEYKVMSWLGKFALRRKIEVIEIGCQRTDRNQPAFDFLNMIDASELKSNNKSYILNSHRIAKLKFSPNASSGVQHIVDKDRMSWTVREEKTDSSLKANVLQNTCKIATQLYSLVQIQEVVKKYYTKSRNDVESIDHHSPNYSNEKKLIEIVCDFLEIDYIGEKENFFDLGLNSLSGVQICSKIHEYFWIKLSLQDLFGAPTIGDLKNLIASQQREYYEKINKTHLSDFPLSFSQLRVWFFHQLSLNKSIYNVPSALRIKGMLDVNKLERALNVLMYNQQALRTVIVLNGQEEPRQAIKEVSFCLLKEDLRAEDQNGKNSKMRMLVSQEASFSFDLQEGTPIRGRLIRLDDMEYLLLITMHHIISDERSWDVFYQELSELYNVKELDNLVPRFSPLSIQYTDFSVWQRELLSGELLKQQLNYWENKLLGVQGFLNLPTKIRPVQSSNQGAAYKIKIDNSVYERIILIGKQRNTSLFMTLLAVFYILLYRYANQKDLVIGIPISNRHYPGVQNIIGFFVNTLALRMFVNDELTFDEFLGQVREMTLEAYANQDLPFEFLVNHLKIKRDLSCHPLFQVMFLLKDKNENEVEFIGLETRVEEDQHAPAIFDLTIQAEIVDNHLKLNFIYDKDLFEAEVIEQIAECYKVLLTNIAQYPNSKINLSLMLDAKEKYKILEFWNLTDKQYSDDKTIHTLFEEQVAKTPDNIAVIYENVRLTYQELNVRSNRLAHYLRSCGVKSDTLVVLFLDRNECMLTALLAVLKANGAYVPIDSSYPDERIKYILKDTNCTLVLTNHKFMKKLQNISTIVNPEIIVLAIDSPIFLRKYLSLQPKSNLIVQKGNDDLAYVIYTSGTTGNPKGVMIEHRGVVNLAEMQAVEFDLINKNNAKNCLWYANYAFDAHVWEVYACILNGHILHIINDELKRDITLLGVYIQENAINVATIPPALLTNVDLLKLEVLIVAGDSTDKKILDFYRNNDVKIMNAYGPTEVTVCASFNWYNNNGAMNIGSPIKNVKCYVLDNLVPLPVGAVGELYIGGVGIARGYLNLPEITNEKFLTNPFQTENEKKENKNAKLYKTGDLVRWLANGNLEFVGRIDSQVKINGHRIELREIENCLSQFKGINQVAVLAKYRVNTKVETLNSQYLVGYYVSDNKLNEHDILNFLAARLPEYMLPSVFVCLKALPLTTNGKLNIKLLPEPKFTYNNVFISPRSVLEQKVCQMFAEVLGLAFDKIGVKDDFFELGGDSILSMKLVSKLKKELNLNVSVAYIFRYKTIEKFCANINTYVDNVSKIELNAEQELLTGEVPLLPIQEWFFEREFAIINHWNQSFLTKTPNLDIERLQDSLSKLFLKHDSFRLRFKKARDSIQSNYIQYYAADANAENLKILDVRTLRAQEGSGNFSIELQEALTDWQSNFHLEFGPIYSVGYIYGYADESARIYFALHHLIVDAMSWRILIDDLKDIYYKEIIDPKRSNYRQWVNAVSEYSHAHRSEKNFWENLLLDYSNGPQLNEIINAVAESNITNFELNQKETIQLLRKTNRAYSTNINDILLTAFGYTLSEITHNKVNYLMLEGHGREEINKNIDITTTLGWFTTMFPIKLQIGDSVGNTVKNVKEYLRLIPNKGLGFGALIGYRDSLPKIRFNYLGQFDKERKLPVSMKQSNAEMYQQDGWIITDEESGISSHPANQDENVIDIDGLIIHGKLKFSIKTKLSADLSAKITILFKEKLKNVVDHCINQNISEYTMSDFEDFKPYEVFNQTIKGNSNSIFIFPPGEGGAESYCSNILTKLDSKKTVLFNSYYGYLKNKLGIDYVAQITFEQLANDHILYIKSIQPKGPYNLFGWSFGAVLAFEVARQLINLGDVVLNVILIDPFFNYKMAVLETEIQLDKAENIHYQYSPIVNSKMLKTNFVLFKALKIENDLGSEDAYKVYKYYVENTRSNNFNHVLNSENFKLITMGHDHSSWRNDESQVIKICHELLRSTTSVLFDTL